MLNALLIICLVYKIVIFDVFIKFKIYKYLSFLYAKLQMYQIPVIKLQADSSYATLAHMCLNICFLVRDS